MRNYFFPVCFLSWMYFSTSLIRLVSENIFLSWVSSSSIWWIFVFFFQLCRQDFISSSFLIILSWHTMKLLYTTMRIAIRNITAAIKYHSLRISRNDSSIKSKKTVIIYLFLFLMRSSNSQTTAYAVSGCSFFSVAIILFSRIFL